MTSHQTRKINETYVEGDEELDAASLREHEEFTKVKNIPIIGLGRYEIGTWYFSPFPPEYNDCLGPYFCEFCLNFMRRKEQLQGHMEPSDMTAIKAEDILITLQSLELKQLEFNVSKLIWTPYKEQG